MASSRASIGEQGHPPAGRRMTESPAAAEMMRRPAAGHQATQCTRDLRFQMRMQRPVCTSHSRTLPSSEPDTSHCPLASTATLRTCNRSYTSLRSFTLDHEHPADRLNKDCAQCSCHSSAAPCMPLCIQSKCVQSKRNNDCGSRQSNRHQC